MRNYKLIVLDDDPTGIQTVHGCLLITDWSDQYVREAFLDDEPFFYILTNTRAMTREEAEAVTREAMEAVVRSRCTPEPKSGTPANSISRDG